jgi:hypothetical protein
MFFKKVYIWWLSFSQVEAAVIITGSSSQACKMVFIVDNLFKECKSEEERNKRIFWSVNIL